MPSLPCCIAENVARPSSPTATTSPSSTQSGVRSARSSVRTTVGKRSTNDLSFRLRRSTLPPRIVAIARKPSHFTSKSQPSPVGTSAASVASIGA